MTTELDRQLRELGHGDHCCLIYETAAEQMAAIVPFLKEGLARQELCIYIADGQTMAELASALEITGMDVSRERERGALWLLTKQETYLRSGSFDTAAMIDFLRQTLMQALAAGFSGLRVTGEMTWALETESDCNRLIEYEALLNRFLSDNRILALCQYNRSCFPLECIDQILRSHPVVVLGDQVCPNLFFETPRMVLGQASPSERGEWMIGQLTRARAAERALQESHSLLHAVVEGTTDAVFVKDPQGHYLMMNSAGARFLGRSVEEVLGKDDAELFAPETARSIIEDDRRIMATGETETYEEVGTAARVTRTYHITKGPYRDQEGKAVGIIGIARDISESKALQAERDRLLERHRLQIDRLPLAYILFDADLRVLDWNPAAETMFGYAKEEALGRDLLDLIVPLPLNERAQEVLDRVLTGDMQAHSVNENRTKDGRIITCEWFSTPPLEEDGRFVRAMLAQDVTERKQAEEDLARDALLLANVRDSVIVTDLEGVVTYWNEGATRLFGRRAEEMLGRPVVEKVPEPERARRAAELQAICDGNDFSGEWEEYRKDGSRVWIDSRVTRLTDATGRPVGLIGLSHDISDRKRAEEELKRQKEILQTVFDHIPVMIRFMDPAGRIPLVNRHWEDVVGWSLEEVQHLDVYAEVYPDPLVRRQVLDYIRSAVPGWADFRSKVRNGRTLDTSWANVLLSDGTSIGFGLDITERKREEQALRESEEQVRLLLNSTGEAIYGLDLDGRCTFCNASCLRLLGYAEDRDLLGKKIHELIHHTRADGTPYPREECRIFRAFRHGEGTHAEDEVLWRADGTSFPAEYWSYPVRRGEDVVGAVVTFVDISERRRVEAALRESAGRLQALSRRVIEVQEEERRHLARELHDEIGQVLSAISINLQAVKGVCDPAARPRLEESIALVDGAIHQARNLSLDLRPSMLDDLGLVATLRWYADRQAQRVGFALHFTAEPSGARLPSALEIACYRVAQEALTNVVRHAQASRVWLEFREREEVVELAVRDDGVGFYPAAVRAARGASFGVQGMQERVELLGGQIEIKSKPTQGTTIRVRFPLTSAADGVSGKLSEHPDSDF